MWANGLRLLSLRRIRRGWQKFRPLPVPRYVSSTPRIGADQQPNLLLIPGPDTLAAAATSEQAVSFVIGLIDKLTPTQEIAEQQAYYRFARAQFGPHFRDADLTTTLWAAAMLIRPTSYLEIGVRRGRSAAVVAAMCPDCAIFGFDLWMSDYAGAPNPGPDFVRKELLAVGHHGSVELISGDSSKTVSPFLQQCPDLFLDLITVDGDHSVLGAATDLANVLPRLKVGGIVIFDDVRAPNLQRAWDQLVKRDSRYVTWECAASGRGIAAAIRIGDRRIFGRG